MPPRSKVAALPDAVKSWLDAALHDGNFSGYQALAEALNARGHNISKSAVHRYGDKLERRLAAVRASTEAAKQIAAAAPDDADERSAAVMSMVQTEMFNALVTMQEAEEEDDPVLRMKILSGVAANIATLSRAAVNQRKWRAEVVDKIRDEERKKALKDATGAAKQAGASKDTIAKIRAAFLGRGE